MRTGADLPYSLNPQAGFLVSANNRPAETEVPAGFFFSPDDRVRRMTAAWMKSRSKLGGQNKVPRIINDRALFSALRRFADVYDETGIGMAQR